MKSMEVREYVVCYFDLLGQRAGLIERLGSQMTFGIDRRNVLGSLVRGIRSIRTTLDFYREKAKLDDHAGIIARKYALLQMYWMQRTGALEKYFDSTQPPLSQPISPSQDAQIKSNPVSQ